MDGSFDFIGLEIHSSRMWQLEQVNRTIDFMADHGFNALIFHQSDLMNTLVLPEKYVTVKTMWEKFSALRYFAVENNQHYLNLVARRAKKRGIGLYLNVKEIFYPDDIAELYPQLIRDNAVACPSDPFWFGYLEACFEELCERVPDLEGVILSAGTHESRTSITRQNPCTCERCRNLDGAEWYRHLFESIYRPLARRQKKLVVRDFTFTRKGQSVLLRAAEAVPSDVAVSLKNTPHDYYPTFPNNPRIGTTGHTEYVEFDTWGQFFGGGFFPVSIAEDIAKRIRYCRERGVSGVLCRTDWEGMYENSTFNSTNMINLYAFGLLANHPGADLDMAYREWGQAGWIDALTPGSGLPLPGKPADPGAWVRMKDFVKASWQVMRKTVYVRDHWFCEDNMFPDSLDKAFKMMVTVHGRDDWEPGASRRLDPTVDENLEFIMREKREAVREAENLRDILKPEACGFPAETIRRIDETLDLYRWYAQIGLHSAGVVFLTRRACMTGAPGDERKARSAVASLRYFRENLEERLELGEDMYPHIVYWLLNTGRMDRLADDAERLLGELRGKGLYETTGL